MNLLEVVSTADVNGAVRHCADLTRELAHRGHRVHLLCPRGSWIRGQLSRESVHILDADFLRWSAAELIQARDVVRNRDVEVIHTHTSRAHQFGQVVAWLSGVPCVATAHNQLVQLNWMFHSRVIATCRATARFQHTRNLVRAHRIEFVHNFVDLRRFAKVPLDSRAETRRSFGIEASSPVIGAVGRVEPAKDPLTLVRALPRIAQVIPEVRLLIVGSGPSRHLKKVRDEADRLGVSPRITWAGHRDDVPRLLRAMDLLVHPSLRESLPLAVLEAMASSLPVVATTVAGLPECVVAGETGFLVPPRDHIALADRVTELLRDEELRRRLGAAAQLRVVEAFSVDTQVPRIESILCAAALDGRRRKPFGNGRTPREPGALSADE